MINNIILTKTFSVPPVNRSEILRYAGVKKTTPEIEKLIDECLLLISDKLTYRVCYGNFPLAFSEDEINLSFANVKSEKLMANLNGCRSFILFAATIGLEIDRMIALYGKTSPSKGHMLQAIGAERIEGLCNAFNQCITEEYGYTKPRFSPGYGDLSLELQKDFFRVLEPSRRIGLSLNESMLMTPSKSVTAIIGISDTECENKKQSCNDCTKTNCSYRRAL